MDIQSLLQANCDRLLEQYRVNLLDVRALQETMLTDILPDVVDELSLGPQEIAWSQAWLNDTTSIFHLLRRNNFTKSFALEGIRKTLIWRLGHIWPPDPTISSKVAESVRCLPVNVADPLGRPVVVIQLVPFDQDTVDVKAIVYRAFEQLRKHLQDVNGSRDEPALQYVILLDLKNLSMQTVNFDLASWVLTDVIPRFPGMLAAVFMINFHWTHSGLWNILRRVLPESALSRVFFPTPAELIDYFTPSSLPQDYGGALAPLLELADPLQSSSEECLGTVLPHPRHIPSPSPSIPDIMASSIFLSPTSALNPFYGYPVAVLGTSASLHHGRRRKRDLVRTLARLFWIRWGGMMRKTFWIVLFALAVRLWTRRWLLRSAEGRDVLRTFLSSAFR